MMAGNTASEKAAVSETENVPETTEARGYRKTRRGYVVSDKMDKTVVVAVEDRVKHPLYGKVLRRTSKVKAHDEENRAGVGDLVLIVETRPLSATKRWRLKDIVEKAK
jgi:small subunit ribosomal protein S17